MVTHLKSLDALRGIAVLMVVFFHSPVPQFLFEFGWAGVNLFFILSGFLITRILLAAKLRQGLPYFTHFYGRRIMRLFPVYYMYLIVSASILFVLSIGHTQSPELSEGLADWKNHWLSLLLFVYNFQELFNYFDSVVYSNSYFFGHLWSLSVEIQFYLVFALLIYFFSVRILKIILISAVIITPFLRLGFVIVAGQNVQDLFWVGDVLYISTVFQMDTLSMGACLALFPVDSSSRWPNKLGLSLTGIFFIMALLHFYLAERYHVRLPLSSLGFDVPVYHPMTLSPGWVFNNRYFYGIPLINFMFAAITVILIHSKSNFFTNSYVLHKIGSISYGIYTYHLSISFLVSYSCQNILFDLVQANWALSSLVMLIYLLIVFVISQISYVVIEQWFFKRKEKLFPSSHSIYSIRLKHNRN